MKYLFKSLLVFVFVSTASGADTVYQAIERGDVKAVETFLDNGLDPNSEYYGEPLLWNPIQGCRGGLQARLAIFKLLLERGANPNTKWINGWNVLMYMIANTRGAFNTHIGMYDLAELTVQHKIDLNARSDSGATALILAAAETWAPDQDRAVKKIQKLLIQNKADVNIANNVGNTALFIAFERGDLDLVNMLIDAGAKANTVNHFGVTPLMNIVIGREPYIALANKAVAHGVDVNAQDRDGRTALMYAVDVLFKWQVEDERVAAVTFLIEHGADVNMKDSKGKSVLSMAKHRKFQKVVKVLEDHGAI